MGRCLFQAWMFCDWLAVQQTCTKTGSTNSMKHVEQIECKGLKPFQVLTFEKVGIVGTVSFNGAMPRPCSRPCFGQEIGVLSAGVRQGCPTKPSFRSDDGPDGTWAQWQICPEDIREEFLFGTWMAWIWEWHRKAALANGWRSGTHVILIHTSCSRKYWPRGTQIKAMSIFWEAGHDLHIPSLFLHLCSLNFGKPSCDCARSPDALHLEFGIVECIYFTDLIRCCYWGPCTSKDTFAAATSGVALLLLCGAPLRTYIEKVPLVFEERVWHPAFLQSIRCVHFFCHSKG